MLFPAQGRLGIQLTTGGVSEAAIAATKQFMSSLLDGSLEFGAAIFDNALTALAATLESERTRRQATNQWLLADHDIPSKLLHIIVDVNGDDELSATERSISIDRDRLIGRINVLLEANRKGSYADRSLSFQDFSTPPPGSSGLSSPMIPTLCN